MTNDKREQLALQLMAHSGELIDAVIDGVSAAGAQTDWDSETIEYVLDPIQTLLMTLGVPSIGAAGIEDANTKYWCEVGGLDYEGEYPDPEPEPKTYDIHSKYVDLHEATVSRAKYNGGGLAVVAEAYIDGLLERETLSVNLSAYPQLAEPLPDEFYVKDYAEHEGLADALALADIASVVSRPHAFGPHDARAVLMKLNEEIQ